jgi:hypothetical protein
MSETMSPYKLGMTRTTSLYIAGSVTIYTGLAPPLYSFTENDADLQAGVVKQLSVELDVREVLGNLAGGRDEKTIGHLHDGGLVDNTDVLLVNGLSILETEPQNTLGGSLGDQLDGLNNTVHNLVLNARVLSLGVLTDENGVDVVVGGLEARDRTAGTDVGEEVESPTESQVERDVTLSDGGLKTY